MFVRSCATAGNSTQGLTQLPFIGNTIRLLVTDSFGWDEKSLVSGVQQSSFLNDDFETKREARRINSEPKKTDKKLSLDNFM